MIAHKLFVGVSVAAVCVASLSAQAPSPKARPYVTSKTPWGDPDLQGTYTNKDESGSPFERPSQFTGKTNADVDIVL